MSIYPIGYIRSDKLEMKISDSDKFSDIFVIFPDIFDHENIRKFIRIGYFRDESSPIRVTSEMKKEKSKKFLLIENCTVSNDFYMGLSGPEIPL